MNDARIIYDRRMATSYDDGRRLSPEAEEGWAASVAPFVAPGAMVLDVGAGTGRFARLFPRRFSARVVAVERAEQMRSVGAVHREPGVCWLAGAAERLPVRDRSVDVVWLACVVHYLDLDATGREHARVLAPGGRVLVRSVFPDRFDELQWLRWFPSARPVDEARMPSLESVIEAWRPHGLRLDERITGRHVVARDLHDLADRLSQQAISTLRLIPDVEVERGLAALRAHARTVEPRPVEAPVDSLQTSRPPRTRPNHARKENSTHNPRTTRHPLLPGPAGSPTASRRWSANSGGGPPAPLSTDPYTLPLDHTRHRTRQATLTGRDTPPLGT